MRRLALATAVAFAALAPPVAATPATVDATDLSTFEPSEVTVQVGEAVTWRFGLSRPHYVESDPGSEETFNSSPNPTAPALRDRANPRGSTWPYTFTKPGRFSYHCPIHVAAGMRGVVNVVAPPAADAPPTAAWGPHSQAPPPLVLTATNAAGNRSVRAPVGFPLPAR
jgi:plastocyanin